MANQVDFKPNLMGIREALKQGGVCSELGRRSASIASSLRSTGGQYSSSVNIHRTVAVGRVWTADKEAREEEARSHPMERHCQ